MYMSKIKTTHVGSLPRSKELSELLFKKDKKLSKQTEEILLVEKQIDLEELIKDNMYLREEIKKLTKNYNQRK